jgi:hypothetical protein
MTDEKLIQTLLTAFYNGETTQKEETVLREFFSMKNIPEKWNIDRNLFHTLYDPSLIDIPEKFSERLEKNFDRYIKQKENINQYTKPKKIITLHIVKRLLIATGSIAASILLFIGIFLSYNKLFDNHNIITNTFTDPQEAAIAAEKILMLVSVNLNKEFLPLKKTKDSINKTKEILNNNLITNN